MSTSWNWPGSRWWRVDLHTHSPASFDFGSEADRSEPDWNAWLTAVEAAQIDAVAITDHNSAAAIDQLQQAASDLGRGSILFPGVELTAADGTHLLLIVDPACTESHVADYLSKTRVDVDQRGRDTARSPFSVEQILDACGDDALIVAAHVNCPKGLLELDGQERIVVLRHPRLAAVELVPNEEADTAWLDGSRSEVGRRLPVVWASDGHNHHELGRRFTWIKMTRPTLEGLRLAFLDGAGSLKPATSAGSAEPNGHASLAIESITVSRAKFMGRRDPLEVRFNPWLNSIIGGRGTGKSTLVDLCRKTLGREIELEATKTTEGSLKSLFDRRMSVGTRGDEGLLTARTSVEIVYRREGERFLLAWNQGRQGPTISRLDADAGEPTPEEGDVRERFPVRIYSQKQLFELAQDPDALLTVIDDSSTVRRAELDRELARVRADFLSLRAEARSAHQRALDLPDRRAALSDVRRKLELLQQGSHREVLQTYRLHRQHDAAWDAILRSARASIEGVADVAESLSLGELSTDAGPDIGHANEMLHRANEELQTAMATLQREVVAAVATARQAIARIEQGEPLRTWRTAVGQSEKAFREASAELAREGLSDPDGYAILLERASDLEREIADLEGQEKRALELREKAATRLQEYRDVRLQLSHRRHTFTSETSGETIRVEVRDSQGREELPNVLATILNIGAFADDRQALAEMIRPNGDEWQWSRLDDVVARLRRVVARETDEWPSKDGRFLSALRKTRPESLDRLALYLPEDGIAVSFRETGTRRHSWRPLTQGSPGQQTAALLAFVLGYGSEPILLDQPEDDLDNTLIYELLVNRLRETKVQRQVIVVTHNPNIVVHGDAEFVLSLESRDGQSSIACSGGLQEQNIRDEICRVMEGGREAFERRYRRIMPASDAN